ncbi:hypothetical protein A0H76_1325 [Hepatospora eriocheir]|uniref:Uncharacterized protein n=1 Tax=Hepatospora eriocheir TaxID=1081669 RepID=A0A1X0QHA3_9MICR|nr:hypothetical protein HERIO_1906 [Hepatospora eriocheir]ORD99149.1 hypothetical protein A0H76_1325 [Hepatospora eriocheir]
MKTGKRKCEIIHENFSDVIKINKVTYIPRFKIYTSEKHINDPVEFGKRKIQAAGGLVKLRKMLTKEMFKFHFNK